MTIQTILRRSRILSGGVIVVAGAAAIKVGAAVIAQIGASLAPAVPTAADYKQSCTTNK